MSDFISILPHCPLYPILEESQSSHSYNKRIARLQKLLNANLISKLTLGDLQVTKRFPDLFRRPIKQIDPERKIQDVYVQQVLKDTSQTVLDTVTLGSFLTDTRKISPFYYAAMSHDAFAQIPIEDIGHLSPTLFHRKMNDLFKTRSDLVTKLQKSSLKQLKAAHLRTMSFGQLRQICTHLPACAFVFLTTTQIETLPIALLTTPQLKKLYVNPSFYDVIDRLSAEAIQVFVDIGFWGILEEISDAQLAMLDLTHLPQDSFKFLFPPVFPQSWFPQYSYSHDTTFHYWKKSVNKEENQLTICNEKVQEQIQQRQQRCERSFIALSLPSYLSIQNKINEDALRYIQSLAVADD